MKFTPPTRDGVSASRVVAPAGHWRTTLEFLSEHFAAISPDEWFDRVARGDVSDEAGARIAPDTAFAPHQKIYYYRSVANEPSIPFDETVLFQDEFIVVADKPHFLPVVPAGRFVQETLLVRLKRKLGIEDLAPAHRIDRDTAGLVLFTVQPKTRGAYHRLFSDRVIEKRYEAIASFNPEIVFPVTRCTRLVAGPAFMQMQEVPGAVNAETLIELVRVQGTFACVALTPRTGQKHQLRAHMAALGMPIVNDRIYPRLLPQGPDDLTKPLQLLARSVAFVDPITGAPRRFVSARALTCLPGETARRHTVE